MEIIKWGNNLFIKNLDDDTYTRVLILGECVGTKHTIEDIEKRIDSRPFLAPFALQF